MNEVIPPEILVYIVRNNTYNLLIRTCKFYHGSLVTCCAEVIIHYRESLLCHVLGNKPIHHAVVSQLLDTESSLLSLSTAELHYRSTHTPYERHRFESSAISMSYSMIRIEDKQYSIHDIDMYARRCDQIQSQFSPNMLRLLRNNMYDYYKHNRFESATCLYIWIHICNSNDFLSTVKRFFEYLDRCIESDDYTHARNLIWVMVTEVGKYNTEKLNLSRRAIPEPLLEAGCCMWRAIENSGWLRISRRTYRKHRNKWI